MARLTHRRLGKILDCAGTLYAHHDVDSFARAVVSIVPEVIPSEYAICSEMNMRRKRVATFANVEDLNLSLAPEAEACYFREHPFVRHHLRTGDVSAMRLSDFLSGREYRKTALYREVFQAFGIEYQLGCTLLPPSPYVTFGLAFVRRGKDFTRDDAQALDLLRPHIFHAYENAEKLAEYREHAESISSRLVNPRQETVAVRAGGAIGLCSPRARDWLAHYFGERLRRDNQMPEALSRWLHRRQFPSTKDGTPPPPCRPMVLERESRRLTIRLLPGSAGAKLQLLLEERPTELTAEPLRTLGLTGRQAEVLLWVAQGKTNPEIGIILGLSAGTVHKHTEHIFEKLGVETRTAAAARAFDAFRQNCD